jgi:recombinational DNA repair protein RecT
MDKKDISKMTIDYHTYKNKLLETYPESIIDIQLVFDGDDLNFSKESGKIIYNHKINNPFAKDKKAIGGYCVIKNRMGEFLEIMNDTEIQKCKQVAKMKTIWNTWETEMYLKTIIKRACKRFFHDIVKEIEDKDNEDYDLSLIYTPIFDFEKFKQTLSDCNSFSELKTLWTTSAKNFTNEKEKNELEMIKNNKKIELNNNEDPALAQALANKFNNDNKGK